MGNPKHRPEPSNTLFGNSVLIEEVDIANFDSNMLDKLWALCADPSIIFLTLIIFCLLSVQKRKKIQFLLDGRLAHQHTINNMLINSISIPDPLRQSEYLRSVAKFVNYGFLHQDKTSVLLTEELEQVFDLIRRNEISNECKIRFEIHYDLRTESLNIIPFALITIIENAIEHGALNDEDHKICLHINNMSDDLYSVSFSGYHLPSSQNLTKPMKGHGLYILKQRLKFIHFEKNTKSVQNSKLMTIDTNKNSLILIFPK